MKQPKENTAKGWIFKILRYINPYSQKCPDNKCHGRIKPDYLNGEYDKLIWECNSCEALWM